MRRNLIDVSPGLVDRLLEPAVYPAAWLLGKLRKGGLHRLPRCKAALERVGVFPVRDHYYEPQFNFGRGGLEADHVRHLSGIDWNLEGQLKWLEGFVYADELGGIPSEACPPPGFHFNNDAFEPGDAETWYQVVRTLRPRRIIEIGSGFSTLMAIRAVERNRADDPDYVCEHTCIEPYEMPWLESTGVVVLRERVERVPLSFFEQLDRNDVLFIDSSHVIRPQGDVLFEFLDLLPTVRPGVVVHIHDVFSPRNYPRTWLVDQVKLWNEQYLLEAFLSHNAEWEVVGALNLLSHAHPEALRRVAPYFRPGHEPGSFYIRRR